MKSVKAGLALFALLMAIMGYSLAQLEFTSVKADAGTCCRFSSGCPGSEICRNLANTHPCCDVGLPGCGGPGHCGKDKDGFEPELPEN